MTLTEHGRSNVSLESWQKQLTQAVRDSDELIKLLELPVSLSEPARRAAKLFPLMVPLSYINRMKRGDLNDPLLRQVLPLGLEESTDAPLFVLDAVGDQEAKRAPGLLHKYAGRALLVTTGACAVHCRYCFRRHYPYGDDPKRLADWEPAFETLRRDTSIHEVILSGGDPLMLTDLRLKELCDLIDEIPHVKRLRIHTRLPIVLPERVTPRFWEMIVGSPRRVTSILVVHANHPQELDLSCLGALRSLVRAGCPVLNQAVLLAGVNDHVEPLAELCEKLVDIGVIPYYLHQLDRVLGTSHFEVPEAKGLQLVAELRKRLPGYAVPQYVREVAGELHKSPIS